MRMFIQIKILMKLIKRLRKKNRKELINHLNQMEYFIYFHKPKKLLLIDVLVQIKEEDLNHKQFCF